MDPAQSSPHQLVGIAFKLASTLAFAAMATLVKLLSERYPIGQIVFFRSFFALIPVFVWVAYRGSLPTVFHTQRLKLHLMRGVVGVIAMSAGFTALSMLPFADATAIGYSAPLLLVVLAVVLLGEKVRLYRWTAVGAGLVGVLIILSDYVVVGPGVERSAAGALIALCGAAFAALAGTMARVLVRTEAAATIVAYFSSLVAIVSLVTIPFGWQVPSAFDATLLVLTGVAGGLGQVLLTTSYRFGDASTIAPFDYVSMLWALAISVVVFGTFPSATVLVGTAVVILAGLFVIFREHRLGIERADSKRAQTPTTPLS